MKKIKKKYRFRETLELNFTVEAESKKEAEKIKNKWKKSAKKLLKLATEKI